MKRLSDNKRLDKLAELHRYQKKKVKGADQAERESVDSSDQEEDGDEEILYKAKRKRSDDSQEERRPREIKKKKKLVYDDEDEMTDGNDDECYLCEDGGNILCCDNCFRSFHLRCLKLNSHPDDDWLCPYCKDLKENLNERCANCTKGLKDTESYKRLTCSKCLRKMHWDCIDTPLNLIVDAPINRNFVFSQKIVSDLKHNFFKHGSSAKELITDLHTKQPFEYLYHVCNTCMSQLGLQKIKKNSRQQFGDSERDYYLVKLKRSSDIHTYWLNQFKVDAINHLGLKNFIRKMNDDMVTEDQQINLSDGEAVIGVSESFTVEKILAFKRPLPMGKKTYSQVLEDLMSKKQNKKKSSLHNYKFLVKWEDLEYNCCTWEDEAIVMKFKDKVKQYFNSRIKAHDVNKKPPLDKLPKFLDLKEQPDFAKGQLFDYQFIGLKWLVNQYLQKKNAILADEMGLGKTIQTLCFFRFLTEKFGYEGPFIVVAPNSTIYNWQREAQKWCPDYEVVIYVGSAASRKKIIDFEFANGKTATVKTMLKPKFQLLITTYSMVNTDVNNLKRVKWEVVVVDEAQRLKNKESKLYSLCDLLITNFKLLLTGTPIQNSIDELINLFKYLIPKDSSVVKQIDDLTAKLTFKPTVDPVTGKKVEIDDTEKKNALRRLKGILKEHMLRRTVQDAGLKFPELEEKVVKLDLSSVQKLLYKNILVKNYEILANTENITKGKPKKPSEHVRISLINILMHLRLVCDHPDLFHPRRRDYDEENEEFEKEVVKSSNKLRLLDKIIPKLLSEGHKLLIFSQFVLMLDIIEDFLVFRNLDFERLDGATKNIDRQKIIDNFNNGKSKIFILSTRAGGLGINLTSSDTIIFVDSDFNPYRDIQAFCRAYRIGQKNKVMVYRLVSKYTVEEKIVENATKKLMMGEMIMNPVDQSKSDKSILESMLRYGTKELFDKLSGEEDDEDITEEKLEELLKREPKPVREDQKKTNDLNDYYLSGFNFIDFNFTPILQTAAAEEETKDNKYWETLLGNEYKEYEKQTLEDLGKGKRNKRNTAMLNESEGESDDSIDIQIPIEMSSASEAPENYNSDSEYDVSDYGGQRKENRFSNSSDEEEDEERDRIMQSISNLPETLKEYYTQLEIVYDDIKDKTTEELWNICGLDEGFRMKFVEFVLKFGVSPRLEDLAQQIGEYLTNLKNEITIPDLPTFRYYLRYFYACLLTGNPSQTLLNFFFCGVHPYAIRKRILGFSYLGSKLGYYRGKIEKFKIISKEYSHLMGKKQTSTQGSPKDRWTNYDDFFLCEGLYKYGAEEWIRIVHDLQLWDHSDPKTLKPEQIWRMLFRKIEGRDPGLTEEKEAFEFVIDYLRMRGYLLMDLILQEKEKKKKKSF